MALGVTAYSEAPFGAEASDVIAYPSGIELTAQENAPTVTADANVPVTGQALTGTLGTAIAFSLVEVSVTGESLTSTLGTVTEVPIGQQVNVTGFELNLQASNPTNDTLTAFGEAPFASLSPATFNIPVETETIAAGYPSGEEATMSLGTVAVTGNASLTLTGQEMTMQENAPTVTADANAPVTGQVLTSNLGTATLDANTIASPTGQEMTVVEGTAVLDANTIASPTGQEMTMQENAPTVTGDANVPLTGISFAANLGTAVLDANTLADATGQELTIQEGQADATDSVAKPTGIGMTMATGSVKTVVWTEVNTGSTSTWTEVDTAA